MKINLSNNLPAVKEKAYKLLDRYYGQLAEKNPHKIAVYPRKQDAALSFLAIKEKLKEMTEEERSALSIEIPAILIGEARRKGIEVEELANRIKQKVIDANTETDLREMERVDISIAIEKATTVVEIESLIGAKGLTLQERKEA